MDSDERRYLTGCMVQALVGSDVELWAETVSAHGDEDYSAVINGHRVELSRKGRTEYVEVDGICIAIDGYDDSIDLLRESIRITLHKKVNAREKAILRSFRPKEVDDE